MPSTDDDIIRGGPVSYWLKYKVTKLGSGWKVLLGVALISFVAGALVF